jgi:hypothetical protein
MLHQLLEAQYVDARVVEDNEGSDADCKVGFGVPSGVGTFFILPNVLTSIDNIYVGDVADFS